MNDTPTAWAMDFAERHGLRLRYETPLPNSVSGYKYDDDEDGPVVVLDSALPEERQHFALAHEAAHILLGHGGEVEENEEREANLLASELLLPQEDFAPHTHRSLHELKEWFPHASHEALARRRLAFVEGVLTIVDNLSVTQRLTSESFSAPATTSTAEWEVIRQAYDQKSECEREIEGLRLTATYVATNPAVERVLLFVEAS